MTIKVLVNGAKGKMGSMLCQTLIRSNGFELFGQSDSTSKLKDLLNGSPDVVVDLTTPNSVFENAVTIIESEVRPIIGTSGLTIQQIQEIQKLCSEKNLGGIIAPNFSIGAMLMIKCSEMLAHSFEKAEIIELHHDQKLDNPSSTSKQTAEIIHKAHSTAKNPITGEDFVNKLAPPIHSVRLPGLLAHQQVIFGSTGETLTIKHDSISRECFMPGILFACKQAMIIDGLIYGLENLL